MEHNDPHLCTRTLFSIENESASAHHGKSVGIALPAENEMRPLALEMGATDAEHTIPTNSITGWP